MKVHFISGLPRSGSTLLSAILRQNPSMHAGMSSPVALMCGDLLRSMSVPANPLAFRVTDEQRKRVIQAAVQAFYSVLSTNQLIFDTNRAWCALVGVIASVFPESRILCCIRSPAWILDSIEQVVQRNPLQCTKLFPPDMLSSQDARLQSMLMKGGLLQGAMAALQQAWFGEQANRLIAVRYESLVAKPAEVIEHIYDLLGESPFEHDFNNLDYSEAEFDEGVGIPTLHTVRPKVENVRRQTILPPEVFSRFERAFWELPNGNPRGVKIL